MNLMAFTYSAYYIVNVRVNVAFYSFTHLVVRCYANELWRC